MNDQKTLLTGKKWIPSELTDVRKTMRQASPEYDEWLSAMEKAVADAEYNNDILEDR